MRACAVAPLPVLSTKPSIMLPRCLYRRALLTQYHCSILCRILCYKGFTMWALNSCLSVGIYAQECKQQDGKS